MATAKSLNKNIQSIPSGYSWIEGSERRPSPKAEYIGPADADETLRVTIVLRRRPDGPPVPGFDYFAMPPRKRPRLSANEFAAKYGADPTEIASIVEFAQKNGLHIVQTHSGRRTVVVSGTVAHMNAAFAVKLERYRHNVVRRRGRDPETETYRGRNGFIGVPQALSKVIVGVFGLDNRRITKRAMSADPPVTNPLTVQQIAQWYAFPTNSAAGQTIAIFCLDHYDPSDINKFFGGSPPTIVEVPVDNEFNSGLPGGETTADICIAASAAPGATIAVYMVPGSLVGYLDAIHHVVHPDPGEPICFVLSTSYYVSSGDDLPTLQSEGLSIGFINAIHQALEDAALQSVTFCVCSGDQGTDANSDNQAHVIYPASDPWALACGGTTVGWDSANGNLVQYVWNDAYGATGGGVSNYFPVPSYQNNVNIPNSYNGGQKGRGVPDVSGNASAFSGYQIILGGQPGVFGGTSAVAPLYAGLIAVINAALGEPVGFLNPTLYALGSGGPFWDVNPFATNPPSGPLDNGQNAVPGYPAMQGWDACTGWGSIIGQQLLSSLQLGTLDCYVVIDWGTFAKAGIAEMQAASSTNTAVFPNAFYVVVDGFTPAALGISTANPVTPSVSFSPQQPSGMSYQFGPAVPAGAPATPNSPQRFTFACQITFTDTSGFPAAPQQIEPIQINTTVTSATNNMTVAASAMIELTSQTGPFMVAGATSWLSDDIRVFQIQPNQSLPGLASVVMQYDGNEFSIPSEATQFIQNVIWNFNQIATSQLPPNHPFDLIPTGEQASILDTLQFSATNNPVVNFAVARVRYQDLATDAEGVRVFFRTFPALALATTYDQSSTYRRWSDNVEFGHTIPLLGSQFSSQLGMQLETIPFFAQERVAAADVQLVETELVTVSMDTQTDQTNVQTIPHDPNGNVTYAYYGCWLDTNQTSAIFPAAPTNDGPFPKQGLQTISQLFDNQHQCITAEIAFDPIPIPQGAAPGSNAMLGQRNLALGPVANPGNPASRRVSSTFEIRSTPKTAANGQTPDELMFDWGEIPAGATATLYLPAAAAAQILALAAKIYAHHELTQLDEHTISWPAGGISYVPLPAVADGNIAGLVSIELPVGIKRGQIFKILVRQLTSVDETSRTPDTAAWEKSITGQRKVVGAFQLTVPVRVKEEMLASEERLLSVLRWIRESKNRQSKWFAVFCRYVDHITARVAALGGNPRLVQP